MELWEMRSTRRPHFLDVFSPNSSSDQLIIPKQFIKHLEGLTSGFVTLTGPSGSAWAAELIQQKEDLYFGGGWSVFVRDHCVESGDFLVFRYDGALHFTVQVFDCSACEKESAFGAKCTQVDSKVDKLAGQKREREKMIAWRDKVNEAVSKKFKESSSDVYNGNPEVHVTGDNHSLVLHSSNYSSTVSDLEEKRIAETFTSPYPYFVRTMKRFNVSGSYTLNVPYRFSTEHLPNCKTEIVLRNQKGGSWTVNSLPTTRVHTSHTFCGGWLKFVRGNEIKMDDVCTFELVGKYELYVNIFRVGKEDSGSQDGKELETLSKNSTHKFLENLAKKSIKNSQKIHSKSLNSILMSDKKGSKPHDKSKPGKGRMKAAKVSKMGNENPDIGIGSLRAMVVLDEQKAAQSFKTQYPSFVRFMRQFNISGSYTLKIPYQFSMSHLPPYKTEIVLCNTQGRTWIVNSVPDSKGRMTHTFCGGWMAFVRDNNLQMGDICIFELVSNSEMRVHITGIGRRGAVHQQERSTELVPYVSTTTC